MMNMIGPGELPRASLASKNCPEVEEKLVLSRVVLEKQNSGHENLPSY